MSDESDGLEGMTGEKFRSYRTQTARHLERLGTFAIPRTSFLNDAASKSKNDSNINTSDMTRINYQQDGSE